MVPTSVRAAVVVLSALIYDGLAASAKLAITQVNAGKIFGVNVTVGIPVDGTPPQVFSMLLSISQPYSWIPSVDCVNCNFLAGKPYNHTSSATYITAGANFSDTLIELIDNDAPNGQMPHGFLSHDTLALSPDLLIPNSFMFGELTEGRFIDFTQGFDGVLGLGMTTQNGLEPSALSQYNVVMAMKDAKVITSAIVGLWLDGTLGNQSSNGQGEISFGGINEELLDMERLTYFPLVQNPEKNKGSRYPNWRIHLQSVLVNGELVASKGLSSYALSSSGVQTTSVSFNTATYWIVAPQSGLDAIAAKIGATNSANSYMVSSSTNFNITWTFVDEGAQTTSMTLTNKDLVSPSVFGPEVGILLMQGSDSSELPSDIGWVFGTIFMNTRYTILDYEQQRIGFAPKKERTTSAPAASNSNVLLV